MSAPLQRKASVIIALNNLNHRKLNQTSEELVRSFKECLLADGTFALTHSEVLKWHVDRNQWPSLISAGPDIVRQALVSTHLAQRGDKREALLIRAATENAEEAVIRVLCDHEQEANNIAVIGRALLAAVTENNLAHARFIATTYPLAFEYAFLHAKGDDVFLLIKYLQNALTRAVMSAVQADDREKVLKLLHVLYLAKEEAKAQGDMHKRLRIWQVMIEVAGRAIFEAKRGGHIHTENVLRESSPPEADGYAHHLATTGALFTPSLVVIVEELLERIRARDHSQENEICALAYAIYCAYSQLDSQTLRILVDGASPKALAYACWLIYYFGNIETAINFATSEVYPLEALVELLTNKLVPRDLQVRISQSISLEKLWEVMGTFVDDPEKVEAFAHLSHQTLGLSIIVTLKEGQTALAEGLQRNAPPQALASAIYFARANLDTALIAKKLEKAATTETLSLLLVYYFKQDNQSTYVRALIRKQPEVIKETLKLLTNETDPTRFTNHTRFTELCGRLSFEALKNGEIDLSKKLKRYLPPRAFARVIYHAIIIPASTTIINKLEEMADDETIAHVIQMVMGQACNVQYLSDLLPNLLRHAYRLIGRHPSSLSTALLFPYSLNGTSLLLKNSSPVKELFLKTIRDIVKNESAQSLTYMCNITLTPLIIFNALEDNRKEVLVKLFDLISPPFLPSTILRAHHLARNKNREDIAKTIMCLFFPKAVLDRGELGQPLHASWPKESFRFLESDTLNDIIRVAMDAEWDSPVTSTSLKYILQHAPHGSLSLERIKAILMFAIHNHSSLLFDKALTHGRRQLTEEYLDLLLQTLDTNKRNPELFMKDRRTLDEMIRRVNSILKPSFTFFRRK